jgi:TetR/AcrR family transcriptional regulator, cholesterol catabolism regulator
MASQGQEKARKRGQGTGKGSARRTQLLSIAAELFATRGYSQTTVRDIADEAGILSGSLYHHFDSKEAMLEEILRQFMDGLLSRFTAIVEGSANPRETLDELIRASFATIHAESHAVALYQNEAALLNHVPEFEFVPKTGRAVEAVWLNVLVAGRESGDFRQDLDSNIVYRFIRDTVWASVRWYNPRGKLQHEKVADQFITLLHGGLLTR